MHVYYYIHLVTPGLKGACVQKAAVRIKQFDSALSFSNQPLSDSPTMFGIRGWFNLSVLLVVTSVCYVYCSEGSSELEEQLQVLSKQVKALLDRRKEDLEIIEDSLRRKLFKSPEINDVQEEMKSLRLVGFLNFRRILIIKVF